MIHDHSTKKTASLTKKFLTSLSPEITNTIISIPNHRDCFISRMIPSNWFSPSFPHYLRRDHRDPNHDCDGGDDLGSTQVCNLRRGRAVVWIRLCDLQLFSLTLWDVMIHEEPKRRWHQAGSRNCQREKCNKWIVFLFFVLFAPVVHF